MRYKLSAMEERAIYAAGWLARMCDLGSGSSDGSIKISPW